jgi:hypothetical protein
MIVRLRVLWAEKVVEAATSLTYGALPMSRDSQAQKPETGRGMFHFALLGLGSSVVKGSSQETRFLLEFARR